MQYLHILLIGLSKNHSFSKVRESFDACGWPHLAGTTVHLNPYPCVVLFKQFYLNICGFWEFFVTIKLTAYPTQQIPCTKLMLIFHSPVLSSLPCSLYHFYSLVPHLNYIPTVPHQLLPSCEVPTPYTCTSFLSLYLDPDTSSPPLTLFPTSLVHPLSHSSFTLSFSFPLVLSL